MTTPSEATDAMIAYAMNCDDSLPQTKDTTKPGDAPIPDEKYPEAKFCCTVCASKRRCSICNEQTSMACSDCAIDLHAAIYVCGRKECRDAHELKCPHCLIERIARLEAERGDARKQCDEHFAEIVRARKIIAGQIKRAETAEAARDFANDQFRRANELLDDKEAALKEKDAEIDRLKDENEEFTGRVWCALGQPLNVNHIQAIKDVMSENARLRAGLEAVIDERDSEIDMMHCGYHYDTQRALHDAWIKGVQQMWIRLDVIKQYAKAALAGKGEKA